MGDLTEAAGCVRPADGFDLDVTQTDLAAPTRLDAASLDLLFAGARTTNTFTPEPVDPDVVHRAYDQLRWAPTSMNIQPLRLTALVSRAARESVVAHLGPRNQAKTLAAPLSVVAAYDPAFHTHLDVLAPHREGLREQLEGQPERRDAMARTNALIQLGYLIVALRAEGLQVGPIGGLDPLGVDAAVHAENGWRTLAVLNLGHAPDPADPTAQRPRAGRLEAAQAVLTR